MNEINLPAVIATTTPVLQALTDALGVSRDVVASDDEIQAAWGNLPRAMRKIPPALRDKGMANDTISALFLLTNSMLKWLNLVAFSSVHYYYPYLEVKNLTSKAERLWRIRLRAIEICVTFPSKDLRGNK